MITGFEWRRWTGKAASLSRARVRKEADLAYYRQRAREEMGAAESASCDAARASHLQLSTQYAILADMIRSELGRPIANDDEA